MRIDNKTKKKTITNNKNNYKNNNNLDLEIRNVCKQELVNVKYPKR